MNDILYEKQLPQEVAAERSVLGAVLLDNNVLQQAVDHLEASAIYLDSHRRIYKAMQGISATGQPVDMVTLTSELRRTGEFEQVGGATYISSLIDGVPRTDNIIPYASLIKRAKKRRDMIFFGEEIKTKAFDGEDDIEDIAQWAEQKVFAFSERESQGRGPELLADVAGRRTDYYQYRSGESAEKALIGLSTGYVDLDRKLMGLQPGPIVLAARSGSGKTALAVNVMCNVARAGGSVLFFSLESSNDSITDRALASEVRVDSQQMRLGRLTKEEWKRMSDVLRDMCMWRVTIDDFVYHTAEPMISRCRQHIATHGSLDLVIVDHLQLMAGGGTDQRHKLTKCMTGLLELSREFKVPTLELSQLNRDPESRVNHRPVAGDIAEADTIWQFADVVMFLYREEQYGQSEANKGLAKAIVAKQREGPLGDIDLIFFEQFTRFETAYRDPEPKNMDKRKYQSPGSSAE